MAGTTVDNSATADVAKDFVISRVCHALLDLVRKCFIEPKRMKQWYAANGIEVVTSKMRLRVIGYQCAMKAPDGRVMWSNFVEGWRWQTLKSSRTG